MIRIFKNILLGVSFCCALILTMSDSPIWPIPNIIGIGLLGLFAWLLL